MRWRLLLPLLGAWLLCSLGLRAAEVIPPAPPDHFNDYAGIVPAATAQSLDAELTQFERTTSNQLVVAIYPHMQSDSSIEDYTVRVAQAWGVGQKGDKNGAVLFIFSEDHKLYVQVGYGLEGVLPDALCKQIIANEITTMMAANTRDRMTAGCVRKPATLKPFESAPAIARPCPKTLLGEMLTTPDEFWPI